LSLQITLCIYCTSVPRGMPSLTSPLHQSNPPKSGKTSFRISRLSSCFPFTNVRATFEKKKLFLRIFFLLQLLWQWVRIGLMFISTLFLFPSMHLHRDGAVPRHDFDAASNLQRQFCMNSRPQNLLSTSCVNVSKEVPSQKGKKMLL
jgi:hypothetical protein